MVQVAGGHLGVIYFYSQVPAHSQDVRRGERGNAAMLFSSLVFLWLFLPIVAGLYYFMPKTWRAGKNGLLMVASLLFYGWGEPVYILLMLCSITLNWCAGLCVWKMRSAKKFVLAGAVAANLLLLGYFKYFDFAADAVNALLGHAAISLRDIALPLGISFYTFQALSYVIDLYRGEIKVQKNWFLLALYVSFFPQLIAGPIVRYADVEQQLACRTESSMLVAVGIKRFVYGLAKKVLLANTFALVADEIFGLSSGQVSTAVAWTGALFYALQIYYDFSGYSDMAIGLGKMFGFRFMENFNYPYLSASVQEFWRRWHISLSTWFRNYLYIPLGGNRKGKKRTLFNLMIVFLCTGLWHGANWQFVAWGVYYGVFLIAERIWLKPVLEKHRIAGHVYTLVVVLAAWVIFRAPGLREGVLWLKAMFLPTMGSAAYPLMRFLDAKRIVFALAGILLCGPLQALAPKWKAALYREDRIWFAECAIQLVLLLLCVTSLVSSTYNPFIYFRF